MKEIVVIYHGRCDDGFGGAWAAWKHLGNQAEYRAMRYDTIEVPEDLIGKEVYLIDFSYPKTVMAELVSRNKKVVAIDHHRTAEESVKLAHQWRFDLEHSGAVLAWLYFHPQQPLPKLLAHTEDSDLYRHQLPSTKEIMVSISIFPYDFETWNRIAIDLEDETKLKEYISRGAAILTYTDKGLKELAEQNADEVEFEGIRCLSVNFPNLQGLHSPLGNLLWRQKPPLGLVWSRRRGKIVVSLRSDGSVDAGEIAKKYGGGGHRGAAGFDFAASQLLPWKYLN